MDSYNDYELGKRDVPAVLLDANILIYSKEAQDEIGGLHFLDFLEGLRPYFDWYIASEIAIKLYNKGTYPLFNGEYILNCDGLGEKMDLFPYIQKDGLLSFARLNKLASDDWAQICLAHNYERLLVVTNDSNMFKSAHASLEGRAIAFHNFLDIVDHYYPDDTEWRRLVDWFRQNREPLRNNSSWIIEGQRDWH